MSYEMLVGLEVIDDAQYQVYRNAMTPILKSYGGGFRYDFMIADVLKSDSASPINRVFIIYFKNENNMKEFFSHAEYLKIKEKYFKGAVTHTTLIASYQNSD